MSYRNANLNAIRIDANVPIPQSKVVGAPNYRQRWSDLFHSMKDGESFFVTFKQVADWGYMHKSSFSNSMRSIAKRIGVSVLARQVKGGFRVWKLGVLSSGNEALADEAQDEPVPTTQSRLFNFGEGGSYEKFPRNLQDEE